MAHVAGIGGEILVRLAQTAGRIGAVEIVSTRPLEAARQAEILTRIVAHLALRWPRVPGLPPAPGTVRAATAVQRAIEAQVLGDGWRRPGAGGLRSAAADLAAAQLHVLAIAPPCVACRAELAPG